MWSLFQADHSLTVHVAEFPTRLTKVKVQFYTRHYNFFLLVQIVDHVVPKAKMSGILILILNGEILCHAVT